MTVKDKQELVRLLHLYMDEIVRKNESNIKETKNGNYKNYRVGLKSQYEHARMLATKLSVEVGKGIKSYWEL